MSRFKHLFFVCTNDRDPSDARGSCHGRGAEALLARLKELVKEHKLKGKVRVVGSGCLDYCAKGCVAAAFSEGAGGAGGETWYTHLTPDDAERLFEQHILNNQPLTDRIESQAKKVG